MFGFLFCLKERHVHAYTIEVLHEFESDNTLKYYVV